MRGKLIQNGRGRIFAPVFDVSDEVIRVNQRQPRRFVGLTPHALR